MARYQTTIESTLTPAEAFAYLADFSNARHWDPSVTEASRGDSRPLGRGSTFDLVVQFAGRPIPMRYEIGSFEEPRVVVLEARLPRFTSRDTITVSPAATGSTVHYDALLELNGAGRVFGPIMQLLFNRTGNRATEGLRTALNP